MYLVNIQGLHLATYNGQVALNQPPDNQHLKILGQECQEMKQALIITCYI